MTLSDGHLARVDLSMYYQTVKTKEGVHCSVIEHGMSSLNFQTPVRNNEAKLNSFVQFENEMVSYRAL